MVFDKDMFSFDDKMGDAEFDLKSLIEVVKTRLDGVASGTIIKRVKPNRENAYRRRVVLFGSMGW